MHSPSRQPEHCCALLQDPHGWLWLQLRPSTARHAADALTCFGGKRETGEKPEDCLVRELREELGVQTHALELCCQLMDGPRCIAFFYSVLPRVARADLQVEAGSCAVAVPWSSLDGLALSPWHRQVLQAVQESRPQVDLGSPR